MQFFNFQSPESYHVFQWLCHSKMVDVPGRIRHAFDEVENHPAFAKGWDTYGIARDLLSDQIDEDISELYAGWSQEVFSKTGQAIEEMQAPESYRGLNALFQPLLIEAFCRADTSRIAEALLIRERRWAPADQVSELALFDPES